MMGTSVTLPKEISFKTMPQSTMLERLKLSRESANSKRNKITVVANLKETKLIRAACWTEP